MGFLEPIDKKGVVFRVASDLNLFEKKKQQNFEKNRGIVKKQKSRKIKRTSSARRFKDREENSECTCERN